MNLSVLKQVPICILELPNTFKIHLKVLHSANQFDANYNAVLLTFIFLSLIYSHSPEIVLIVEEKNIFTHTTNTVVEAPT